MAFNKVSMVLLLLLVVATTLADARLDQFVVSSQFEPEELCLACECTEISGTTTCNRTDRKVGGCPSGCSSSCPCTRSIPPICWCTYEVDTCSSEQCPESIAANKRENLLTLKRNY